MNILSAIQTSLSVLKACCLAIAASFLFTSCTNLFDTSEHPHFVNIIIQKMDTAQNKDQAVVFIDSAFKTLPNPHTGDIYIKDSILQYYYGYVKMDRVKAIPYSDSILALLKDHLNNEKNAERYADALRLKAGHLFTLKRYHEYFYAVSEAEIVADKYIGDQCRAARFVDAKAYSLFFQEKYSESASYYLKQYRQLSSSCSEGFEHTKMMASSLNNTGLCFLQMDMLDSAAWYENEAQKIIAMAIDKFPEQNIYNFYAKAVIMGDQAEVLSRQGKYTEAKALFKKSIEGTSAGGIDISYTQAMQARLAVACLNNNQPAEAEEILTALKISLDTFPSEKLNLKWTRLMGNYYRQINKFDSAFAYWQQYQALADAMIKRDIAVNSNDIGSAFENQELRYKNVTLQKESKIKSVWIAGAVVLFISAVAIVLLVWASLRRTRKLHSQMTQKNEDMQKALLSLEQSHTENSRIIRIVAHDLKSPISVISSMTSSLMRKNYPQDLKEIFQVIKTACGNSLTLINDVLQQKKNPATIKKDLVNMKRLLEYCVDLLQPKADEKNQSLTLEADEVTLKLNRQKMWRVVSNIVTNAIKFSPEHAHIDVKLQREEKNVLLSVTDNGIGMPEELQDKIFSMAPEVSRTGTFGEESYGMGLSISRKIVEEHHGRIWFDSVQGKGSVFYVQLPFEN